MLNQHLFKEVLKPEFFSNVRARYPNAQAGHYQLVYRIMERACKEFIGTFEQRRLQGHIKHCHANLSATNLWIRPPRELLALDCVDFNDELCHIDTLSDVAVLVADIEAYTLFTPYDQLSGQALHFIRCYLKEAGESEHVRPLLEYYITEKCMILAHVAGINRRDWDMCYAYLQLAYEHAQKLLRHLLLVNDTVFLV